MNNLAGSVNASSFLYMVMSNRNSSSVGAEVTGFALNVTSVGLLVVKGTKTEALTFPVVVVR